VVIWATVVHDEALTIGLWGAAAGHHKESVLFGQAARPGLNLRQPLRCISRQRIAHDPVDYAGMLRLRVERHPCITAPLGEGVVDMQQNLANFRLVLPCDDEAGVQDNECKGAAMEDLFQ